MPLSPGSPEYTLTGLAEFLKGIASLNDPDKQKRDDLTRQIALHPELSDYYKQNPDALEAAVGGKNTFGRNMKQELLDKVRNAPDSPSVAARKAVEGKQTTEASNAVTSMLPALTGGSPGTIGTALNPKPVPQVSDQQQNIYNKDNGLPSVAQQQLQKSQLASSELARQKSESELADLKVRRGQAQATRKYLADSGDTAYGAYKKLKSLPPDVQLGLTSDPDLAEQVRLGQTEDYHKQTLDLQRLATSNKYDMERLLNVAKINAAQHITEKTGVSPDIVVKLMSDNGLRAKYGAETFQPSTPEEQQYKAAATELNSMGGQISNTQRRQIDALYFQRVNPLISQINEGKIKPESVQAQVDLINQLGTEVYGAHGLPSPTYKYGAEGDKRSIGLMSGQRIFAKPVLYRADNNEQTGANQDQVLTQLQSAIDSGQADYSATLADPRAAKYRDKLRPPNKKKK